MEILQPLLNGNGEVLPLDCEEGDYFLFNVTTVTDALDEASSEIVRFPDGKRIMDIKRFVFVGAELEGADVFKLPQLPLGRVFVTDPFVQAVKHGGLVGFDFKWLWASEQTSSSTVLHSIKLL